MIQFTSISEFNTYLSNNLKNIKLNEYFKEIQSKFYSELDISFMDYFLELITKKDKICIEHQKLIEYGIIKINQSKDIKDCIDKFSAIENVDFTSFKDCSLKPKGGRPSINYKLTPKLFKLCLMRSIKENKYAKYYLLLEECFYYYQEYQIMYQQVLLSGKDDKIDELIKETKKLSEENKKQSAQIDELLGYAKETKEQNEELHNKVDDLKDTMEDIKEDFKETANRSVPNPNDENERHEFILLQHKELNNKLTFMRGIQKLNENKISKKYKEYNIIKREYNANPIQLFKQFKEAMKEKYNIEKEKIKNNKKLKNKNQLKKEVEKIKFSGNNLELQFNYTLNDLLDELTNVCNERFNEYNNYSESP
jgi:hypothetical protein